MTINPSIEKIQIKDLPDELIGRIQKDIEPYEVILLDPNVTEEQDPLLASGTLIQIENKYCILTAKHVTNKLKKLEQIGLNLVTSVHNDIIETSFLHILELDDPNQVTKDPGLAVIILPETKIDTINTKEFWNLTNYKQSVLSKPIDCNNGLFFLCGTIGEWAKIENSTESFRKILSCCCGFMYTGIKKYFLEKEFDYLKLSVSYRKRNDLPNSFCGASGGGIWGTQLYRAQDGRINYSSPLLVGMAFREDGHTNGSRSTIESITGYGWRSIYEQVLSFVTDTFQADLRCP